MRLKLGLFTIAILCGVAGVNYAAVDPHTLASCLTAKGWIMYGAHGCGACSTQKSYFGSAMSDINVINCDEYSTDEQIRQCIANRIDYTPTWLLVVNGKEQNRLEGYKSLEELARVSGCG